MPTTEAKILSTFLLPPATLPSLISLQAFTALFPRSQQSSTQIRTLYRDLQHRRSKLVDAIAQNIATEVKRGKSQQRTVARVRRSAEQEDQDDEVDVENALFGATSNLPVSKPHTMRSIIPDLEIAAEELEDEVRRLDEEADSLLGEMRAIVGTLSDLRYGRLFNGQLREQVLQGLERLDNACTKS